MPYKHHAPTPPLRPSLTNQAQPMWRHGLGAFERRRRVGRWGLLGALALMAAACQSPAEDSAHTSDASHHRALKPDTPSPSNENTAPVAFLQRVTVATDTTTAITLEADDAQDDPLTFSIVTQPTRGTLSGDAPNLTYTPEGGFQGFDSFEFRANDGLLESNTATVTVVVGELPPQAFNQNVATAVDTSTRITLRATDPDDDDLTFAVAAPPENGVLSGLAPDLIYTPAPGFQGFDRFTFHVNDGTQDSNTATVRLTVGEPNEAPEALGQTVLTSINTVTEITLSGIDPENDALTFAIVDAPTDGDLFGEAPNLTYTPDNDFEGQDRFTFRVNDGELNSALATVFINVGDGNTIPTALPQTLSILPGQPTPFTLFVDDLDDDAVFTFTILETPNNGTLSGEAPNLIYTPDDGFVGRDAMTFRVNDGQADSNVAAVTFEVGNFNIPPEALGQSLSTPADTRIDLVLSGFDPEGATLTFQITSPPARGQLLGEAPNLTYLPDGGFIGEDRLDFVVNDGEQSSETATIVISVGQDNSLPEALAQDFATQVNTPLPILLQGFDPDNDPLTFSVVQPPANGQLTGTSPNLTYTPNNDFEGQDRFTYRANDGQDDSTPVTVTVAVGQLNQLPIADNQSLSVDPDTTLNITLTGVDGDNQALAFELVDLPERGALSGTAPNLTYTPEGGFQGIDRFTFTVTDGIDTSAPGTIEITVGVPNRPPVAAIRDVFTAADTPVDFTLSAEDPEDDALTFSVVDAPTSGTLSGTAPNLTYTPVNGFIGVDVMTFIANDGEDDSNIGTVIFSVGVNIRPIANGQRVQLSEDDAIALTLTGDDPEGAPLTFRVVSPPRRGTLSGTAPDLTYTPQENFAGIDTFEFVVNDGEDDSNVATVIMDVLNANDPPSAEDQAVLAREDEPAQIALQASDPDGDELTFTIVEEPTRGVLSGTAPDLIYTPQEEFSGADSFTFTVSDDLEVVGPVRVEIDVLPVNDPPTGEAFQATLLEDDTLALELTATDQEGDPLTFSITRAPLQGTLEGQAPNVTYRPVPNSNGFDSFTYVANDGQDNSEPIAVALIITPVNDPPVALDAAARTRAGQSVAVSLSGADVENDSLTFSIATPPVNGVLSGQPPAVVYTPDQGFEGEDSFTYVANDGRDDSQPATIRVTVVPVDLPNRAPSADPQDLEIDEDEPVTITLTGEDPDDDALTFVIATQPARGSLSGLPPEVVYTPDPDYSGPDSFTFQAFDGLEFGEAATVTLDIAPVNDAPEPLPQVINTRRDEAVNFFLIAIDPENDEVFYRLGEPPSHGTLTGEPPVLTYTPDPGFNGEDSFTWFASDGDAEAEGTLTLLVEDINEPPTATARTLEVSQEVPTEITLTAEDPNDDALTFILLSLPEHGSLTGTAPNLTYTSDRAYVGTDRFSFLVNDGQFNSTPAEITLNVVDLNLAPTTEDLALVALGVEPLPITLPGEDPDGDALTFTIATQPEHGSLEGSPPEVIYTAQEGFVGQDAFTFEVSDGDLSVTGTVTLRVVPQDQPPVLTVATDDRWHAAPLSLRVSVDDFGCPEPPRAVASPEAVTLNVAADGEDWLVTSAPLPVGRLNTNLAVTSACTGLSNNAAFLLGVDDEGPTAAISALPTQGVVLEEPSTWPFFPTDARLPLNALLRDRDSGVASWAATLSEVGDDNEIAMANGEAPANGVPATGPGTLSAGLCDAVQLCDGDRLQLDAIDAGAYTLSVVVNDVAGNSQVTVFPFVVGGLRAAIDAWRGAIDGLNSDTPAASAALTRASARLNDARLALDGDVLGNLLLATEDAQAEVRGAIRLDPLLPDDTLRSLALVVAQLIHGQLEAQLTQDRATSGPLDSFNPVGVALDVARGAIEERFPGDAFLALNVARFWLAEALEPDRAPDAQSSLDRLDRLTAELGSYGAIDPAQLQSAEVNEARDPLNEARDTAAEVVRETPLSAEDMTAFVIALLELSERFDELDTVGVDTLTWRWLLAMALETHADAQYTTQSNSLGQASPAIVAGRDALDAFTEAIDEDDLRGVITQSQRAACFTVGLHNLINDPDLTAPSLCCDPLRDANAIDSRVEVPRGCSNP